MKIECACGEKIHDTTEYLPNKGYVLGDKDNFKFWDAVDAAIESPLVGESPEATCVRLRRGNPSRLVWECLNCGRLYLDDVNHRLVEYVPASGAYNGILNR